MRFHSQSLRKDRKSWNLDGRFWLYGAERNSVGLAACWDFPTQHCSWGVTFGGGDRDRDLELHFSIPFIITVWLTIENFFKNALFPYITSEQAAELTRSTGKKVYPSFDTGDGRQINIYFFGGAIWWSFWTGSMASWSRDYPWCKRWRHGSFHFGDLLGKQKYTNEVVEQDIAVAIEMPEGIYWGRARKERATWKRPLWFAKTRLSTWIDVPRGIPHQGKGESGYDCGDDAVCGTGAEGWTIANAVESFRAAVMKNRKRYGNVSQQTIDESLKAATRQTI